MVLVDDGLHAVARHDKRLGMVAEPVLDHQVPVVLARETRDPFDPGDAHRADHHKYILPLHG